MNPTMDLMISALSSDGAGISRTDRGVVFVSGALPGERVAVEITSRHRDFSVGRAVRVLEPAEGRIEPSCPAYGKCGGCQLQHAAYPFQLKLKAGLVRDAMTRIGGFPAERFENLECVSSPKPWGYRNKAAFPVQSIRGRPVAGFYQAGSHRLIPINRCPVNAPQLNALYRDLLPGLADLGIDGYDERQHRGKLRHIVMRAGMRTDQTLLSFVINGKLSARNIKALVALGSRGKQKPTTLTLNHNSRPGNVILGNYTEALTGEGLITERLDGWTLAFDTTSFFQVNTGQAEQLFAEASAHAEGNILELYSGVGSLTCYLAGSPSQSHPSGVTAPPQGEPLEDSHTQASPLGGDAPQGWRGVSSVTSVEEWRSAVAMAECNMLTNGLANQVHPLCGKAEEVIADLRGPWDTVVMDPPRDGCAPAVLEAIHRAGVPRVVYVSCNPATLARDCKILASHGYRLEHIRAFDMFPQTAHVETVVVMTKR